MSLLKALLEGNGGGAVGAVARSLGLSEDQAGSAVSQLLPALTAGMKRNVAQQGGLESLIGALSGGGHQRYLEDPGQLAQPEGIADGNKILGHLLGSKDVSREVAGEAATATGIDAGILKKMLPMLAGLAMGTLSQQSRQGGALSDLLGAGSGAEQASGTLSSFLDADGDGSITDDLLGGEPSVASTWAGGIDCRQPTSSRILSANVDRAGLRSGHEQ